MMLKPCKFPVTFIKATNTPRGHVSIIPKSDTQRSFLGSSLFMGEQAGRVEVGQFSDFSSFPRCSGCFCGSTFCLLSGTISSRCVGWGACPVVNYDAWFASQKKPKTKLVRILEQRGFLSLSLYNIGLWWSSAAHSVDRCGFWESSLALIWYSEWTAFLQMHLLITSLINLCLGCPPSPSPSLH